MVFLRKLSFLENLLHIKLSLLLVTKEMNAIKYWLAKKYNISSTVKWSLKVVENHKIFQRTIFEAYHSQLVGPWY